jgi:hypothetical protein
LSRVSWPSIIFIGENLGLVKFLGEENLESTKRLWKNPVKDRPASEATMQMTGDFQEFTDLMRQIIHKKGEPKPIAHASPVPAES